MMRDRLRACRAAAVAFASILVKLAERNHPAGVVRRTSPAGARLTCPVAGGTAGQVGFDHRVSILRIDAGCR